MKKTLKIIVALLSILLLVLFPVACEEKADGDSLWENATYPSDTTVGSGENTVTVEIAAGEKSIILTVKTNKSTLGDALYENGIINDISSLFTVCNGITADWNKDQAYWAFYVNDEMAMYGVYDEKATTSGDDTYKIVYTK